jgi:hypothetical protein
MTQPRDVLYPRRKAQVEESPVLSRRPHGEVETRTARDGEWQALSGAAASLEAEIEALLSDNSEEFVIRFIQTSGE